jgi:hypothetical protein
MIDGMISQFTTVCQDNVHEQEAIRILASPPESEDALYTSAKVDDLADDDTRFSAATGRRRMKGL